MSVTSRWRGGAIALPVALAALLAAPPIPGASQPAAPPVPAMIDTRDAPALGPDTARVTIVEFADFQCPFCARGAAALRKLLHLYPDRVRWVFKHFPLRTAHPGAALAHEAAIAAEEQGKFWEMHELIFSDPTRIRYRDLVAHAERLGLDMAVFTEALETRRLRPRVIRDLDEGRRLHVGATPTYFINGIRIMGARTTPEFRALVDAIMRRPPAAAAPVGTMAPPAEGPAGR